MEIRTQIQQARVGDELSAIIAVIRPILEGLLYALKQDVVAEVGGHNHVKLKMLPRLYRPGDRDCGICFEYAVHDAVSRGDAKVIERVNDALALCNVPGHNTASILFGLEKTGALDLINTAKERLTEDSRLRAGTKGQPAKLKRHIDSIAAAFRKRSRSSDLPWSISGVWKADLFMGMADSDRWVATSIKINAAHLEGARGLRIGIVPTREGMTDRIRSDDQNNLIICPLPYDGGFMEVFYSGWIVVQQFIAADAFVPKEVALPRQIDRQVARLLEERREYKVVDIVDALRALSQPELLVTEATVAELISRRENAVTVETGAVLAPFARTVA
jgi:hypothetical protein